MTDLLRIVAYDREWPARFRKEADRLKAVLGDQCHVIHHIGSTAVPGLVAKPIIDLLPVVTNIETVDTCNKAMEALGYTSKGEFGLKGRRYFEKEEFHVHIYQLEDPAIDRHVQFRDYLRTHPEECQAYGTLKKVLVRQYEKDRAAYQAAKEPFIQSIEKRIRC